MTAANAQVAISNLASALESSRVGVFVGLLIGGVMLWRLCR